MIKELKHKKPSIDENSYVAENASVVGEVTLGEGSSIWFGAVVRADIAPVTIGKCTNVQDNATIHVGYTEPTIIGDYVVIGHNATVHGATLGNNILIGMGARVLNGAVVGDNCIIGAGALVSQNKVIPPNSMVVGIPAKVVRQVTEEEIQAVKENAISYSELWKNEYI